MLKGVTQCKANLQNMEDFFFLIPPPPSLLLSFLFIPVFKEISVKTVAEYKLKRQGLQRPHRMKNKDIIKIVYKSH